MRDHFNGFLSAILQLIARRRERLDVLPLPGLDLRAALEDLEVQYLPLVDTTTDADKAEIGEFYALALSAFGSNEEIFAQYPDAAGLLLMLRIEGVRRQAMGVLLPARHQR